MSDSRDSQPRQMVDISIDKRNHVTINKKSDKLLYKQNIQFLKLLNAERLRVENPKLSPAVHSKVSELENALLDNDSQAFIGVVKALGKDDLLADQIVKKLEADFGPVDVTWDSGQKQMTIRTYGDPNQDLVIKTNGVAQAFHLDEMGNRLVRIKAETAFNSVCKNYQARHMLEAVLDHEELIRENWLKPQSKITTRSLVDPEPKPMDELVNSGS